jgi:hypothetical protein
MWFAASSQIVTPNRETSMTKRNLLITTMILIVLSAAITFQALNSATISATVRPMNHASTSAPPTTKIVPSSVMTGSGFFEDDASVSHWGGP